MHPQWKEEEIFQAWHNPFLTLKSINRALFLSLILASWADSKVLIDLWNIQKIESITEGVNIEGNPTFIQPLKFTAQVWWEHLRVSEMMGKNGEEPRYH